MNETILIERLIELSENINASATLDSTDSTSSADNGNYLAQYPAKTPSVEDAISHLRLQGKYLLFDLEATRRENKYLRNIIEGRSKTDIDGEIS